MSKSTRWMRWGLVLGGVVVAAGCAAPARTTKAAVPAADAAPTATAEAPDASEGGALRFDEPEGWTATNGQNVWLRTAPGGAELQLSMTPPPPELGGKADPAGLQSVVAHVGSNVLHLGAPTDTEVGTTRGGLGYAGGTFTQPEAPPMPLWLVTNARGPAIWVTLTGAASDAELAAARRFVTSMRMD